MTLDAIEEGAPVFIDANIFVYHFLGSSKQCTALLTRCESEEIRGVTSALVLAEVCHRLMTLEAAERKLVAPRNIVSKLAARPDLVRQLTTYESAVEAIPSMRIEVTALDEFSLMSGLRIQRRYGLLTNDSLIVATMLRGGIGILATADRRFSIVDQIQTATPTDLAASA
jgi:predicted nucleic acid-binding protein